jgi:hypothetical protein
MPVTPYFPSNPQLENDESQHPKTNYKALNVILQEVTHAAKATKETRAADVLNLAVLSGFNILCEDF